MKGLVTAIEDIDDGEPLGFIFPRKLEEFAIITSIRARAKFLDVLDRNCEVETSVDSK